MLIRANQIFRTVGIIQLLGIVFDVQVRLKLIFSPEIEFTVFNINPQNRCQPPTCLVAIQSQIHQVCSTKILFQLRIQIPVIVSWKIVHPTSGKGRKPIRDLVWQAKLQRINILFSVHRTVNSIHIRRNDGTFTARLYILPQTFLEYTSHSCRFEHRQAIVKRCLTAPTRNGKETGDGPITFFVSRKNTRNHRSGRLSFVIFFIGNIAYCRHFIYRVETIICTKRGIYIPSLESTLDTHTDTETVCRQERKTRRVRQSTIYINCSTSRKWP